MNKTYLGDSVWAYDDGFNIVLVANDYEIFLDPDCLSALLSFIQDSRKMGFHPTSHEY